MTKLLLTPEETAHALGIGRSKVYELILTRALDSVKIGACRRIPADALTAYIDSLCHPRHAHGVAQLSP